MKRLFTAGFSLLLPALPALATEPESFTLNADDVSYDRNEETVAASGDVRVENLNGVLQADRLLFNRKTDNLEATGDVTYVDKRDVAIFAERFNVKSSLESGVVTAPKMRLGQGGPAMAARSLEKEGAHIKLKNSVYSPCPLCQTEEKPPVWQVRAKEIDYNIEESVLKYHNAYLDVYGQPVVYLPYFHHPVGEQKRHSGLIPPRFGRSTGRGEEMTLSYYHALSDHHDYTLRTRLMTRRGAQFMVENRHEGPNGSGEIRGSVIADDKTSSLRSHLEGDAEYIAKPGIRFGGSALVASDDTYLDDFFERPLAFLTSTVYAEKASPDTYLATHATWFQDVRANKSPAQTAQVLPSLLAERVFHTDERGTFTLSGSLLGLHRSQGTRYRRLVARADYTYTHHTQNGQQITFTANAGGDAYHVDGNQGADGFAFRGLPHMALTWEAPLISPGGNHRLTPKVMAVAAPRGGNPEDIPNEDSVAYELDTTNLFDTNRFAGQDRVESGPRIIYGLDNHWGGANRTRWRLFFGQSYRFFEDSALPALGGTGTRASDWVGTVEMRPAGWFGLANRFRLDNSDLSARRLDTELQLGEVNGTGLNLTHTFLDGGPEEMMIKGRYDVTENISLTAQSRQDLTDGGKQLLSEGEFIYTADCYRFSFTVRRRGFNNRDVPPSTDFLFNLELLTLGREAE